jgi:hypothetical protein
MTIGSREKQPAWRVVNVERANITLRRDTVRAAFVEIGREGERRRLTLELSEAANGVGRGLSPMYDVRPYLEEDDPPRRLIVAPEDVYPIESWHPQAEVETSRGSSRPSS